MRAIGEGDFERSGAKCSFLLLMKRLTPEYPRLFHETENRRFPITIRCCGDQNLLVEYGELELDLLLRFQVQALMQAIVESGRFPCWI